MSFRVEIRHLASLEIIDAYGWYDSQRIGLGLEFLESLEDFFESLLRNANAYSYYQEPVRQGRIKRFPYVVIFEVKEDQIVVYSVFMTGKDPSKKRRD